MRDRLRVAMRSNLRLLVWWYTLRGLVPRSHARALLRSGRGFDVADRRLGRIAFEVLVEDGYRMHTRRLSASDVVVDIGGYLGFFGLAAHACGSRRVFSYEAQRESYQAMRRNYERMGGATAYHRAVFRSDLQGGVSLTHPGTGCSGSVLFDQASPMHWHDGVIVSASGEAQPQTVRATSLDTILEPHEAVRLLKVDCEGSEFPILLTSRALDRVQEIVGECHEIPPEDYARMAPEARLGGMREYRLEDLTNRLRDVGFLVETQPLGPRMHMFYGTRSC